MEYVDTPSLNEFDDESILLSAVIQEEYELLFLDSYLRESFTGSKAFSAVNAGGGFFDEEHTI
jgi:hypothetical protein